MANAITGNPIILDSASATAVVVVNAFRVQAILWDPGASGANLDVCTITDKLGIVKFNQTILTGNLIPSPVVFVRPIVFNGLMCTALTHGKAYIYLADNNDLHT